MFEDAFPPDELVTSSSFVVFVSSRGNPFKDAPVEILNERRDVRKIVAPGGLCRQPGQPGTGDDDITVVNLSIIKAKSLIKTDLIGKLVPYAVIKCGDQHDKPQNPEWNHNIRLVLIWVLWPICEGWSRPG